MQILHRFIVSLLLVFLFACENSWTLKSTQNFSKNSSTQEVIYGEDHRVDYFDMKDESLLELARSTVALFDDEMMRYDQVFDRYYLDEPSSPLNFCPAERFRQQPTWGFCSGSLIGPDLVLTAGHCVRDNRTCQQTKIVFDYYLNHDGEKISSIQGQNVFSCSEVVYATQKNKSADFAIIRLDRIVEGREPVKFSEHEVTHKDTLMVIGHPWGWPTKFTMNGKVRSLINEQYITASLDTFSGNSGSAVFDQTTHEVIGVLSRGEQDFVLKNQCHTAKVCDEDGCRGEDVTRITEVQKYLPK